MLKLNSKELKLIYALETDCRRSAKELATASGFRQSSVIQKIKEFETEGIITGFSALIDHTVFGLSQYKIDLSFQNITPEEHNKIIQALESLENVRSVMLLDKDFGVSVIVLEKEYHRLQELLYGLKEDYGRHIADHSITMIKHAADYPSAHLLGKAANDSDKIFQPGAGEMELDDKDLELLSLLARDGRSSLVELSRHTGIPPRTINYRLKKLETSGVVMGYRAQVNKNLIGRNRFRVSFECNAPLGAVREFAKVSPNVVRFEETSPFDYSMTVETEGIESLMGIIRTISERFAPLKKYSYSYIVEERTSSRIMNAGKS